MGNTHVLLDDKGGIRCTYRKSHLFSVHIPEKNLHVEERSFTLPGFDIPPPVSTPVGEVALGIVSLMMMASDTVLMIPLIQFGIIVASAVSVL